MEVRIHSNIGTARQGAAAYKLWLYCRALDVSGQGWISIDISGACSFFALESKKENITVRALLNYAADRNFFYSAKQSNGELTLYMRGLHKVTNSLGLDNWGVVANVPLEAINSVKTHATQAMTLAKQQASKFAAKKSNGAGKYLKFIDHNEVLNTEPSLYSPCGVNFVSESQRVFMDENHFTRWGASQKGVANSIGCSERTVRRRLEGVNRIRQYYHREEYSVKYQEQMFLQREGDAIATEDGVMYKFGNKVYEAHTNLYVFDMELSSMKYSRKKFTSKNRK